MLINKIHLLGKNKEYSLNERALRHIIKGDFVVRPIKDIHGNKTTEDVISGGLHTWDGWETFIAKHPGTKHLLDFDSDIHQEWYFARELQNGVITLKIPRELFSNNAASITMMPDIHYVSGYLWKTLFPKSYTEADILQVIDEALLNIDTEESNIGAKESLIIGYARTMDPFTAIRIRIQLDGNEIRSAFPTWDQPYTGNNGKPYSHEHSISFHIAQSTIQSGSNSHLASRLFTKDGTFNLDDLIKLTPKFLLNRTPPIYGQIQDTWHEKRRIDIAEYLIDSPTESILIEIKSYVNDFTISKEPFLLQSKIYEHYLERMEELPSLFNVAAIMQNISDCFYALMFIDNQYRTYNFLESMHRFMSMSVIHTGGLNTLEYKRILTLLMHCSLEHHDKNSFATFIKSLTKSSIRSALYTEFNVNTLVKENNDYGLQIIGIDGVQMAFKEHDLIEFLSIAMGENYLFNFSKNVRLEFAQASINSNYPPRLIKDSLVYFRGSDFDFFIGTLEKLNEIKSIKNIPTEDDVWAITREYSRMLVIYRQRVVMEDPVAHKADPYEFEFGSNEQFEIIKQQHKRKFIQLRHELGLQALIKFAHLVEYKKLESKVNRLLTQLPKERVPMPKRIPENITSWQQDPKYKHQNSENFKIE